MTKTKTVTSFFDNEYLNYANYVLTNRAIPHCIDGLKPTHRKIIFVANKIWKNGSEKPMKLFQLGGRVAADAQYHHGDSSLSSAMIGMAQKFKNSLPLLDGIGQFGSLRSPSAGAPRYISARLHQNFRLIYQDFELLKNKIEEGSEIEPEYFLPIVPTVILNGSSGIAVGFSTNILNREPISVIDACISHIKGKKIPSLPPYIDGFSGEFIRDSHNPRTWKIKGKYNVINSTKIEVTEIPPSYTYEKYEELLNSLIASKIIVDYEDNSSESVHYIIKFQRSVLKDLIASDKLDKVLKLNSQETENLTTIDENGNLKIFDRVEDIVSHFVNVRLGWYDVRKTYLIDKINKELQIISNRAKFIKDIIEGNLKINNVKKELIIKHLEANGFDKVENSFNYLLNMPIHSLTKERFDELLNTKQEKKAELDKIIATSHSDMYLFDLQKLKKAIQLSKQSK